VTSTVDPMRGHRRKRELGSVGGKNSHRELSPKGGGEEGGSTSVRKDARDLRGENCQGPKEEEVCLKEGKREDQIYLLQHRKEEKADRLKKR